MDENGKSACWEVASGEGTHGRQCGAVQRTGGRTGLEKKKAQAKSTINAQWQASVMVIMVH